jgi:phage shock protein B
MMIGGGLFILGVIFLVVVAPIWVIAHYTTRWRATRRLSNEDEKALGELWQSARRMETRIDALERVLDTEAPGWRMQSGGS